MTQLGKLARCTFVTSPSIFFSEGINCTPLRAPNIPLIAATSAWLSASEGAGCGTGSGVEDDGGACFHRWEKKAFSDGCERGPRMLWMKVIYYVYRQNFHAKCRLFPRMRRWRFVYHLRAPCLFLIREGANNRKQFTVTFRPEVKDRHTCRPVQVRRALCCATAHTHTSA